MWIVFSNETFIKDRMSKSKTLKVICHELLNSKNVFNDEIQTLESPVTGSKNFWSSKSSPLPPLSWLKIL